MLQAITFINAIKADSKPITLRASDGNAYVTKWFFQYRENRRMINECIEHAVLNYMGVYCAENNIVEISAQFIAKNRVALKAAFGKDFANIHPGPVFASKVNENEEHVNNQPLLEHVTNLSDFHAALVTDVFLCQGDKRQAIFERTGKRQYRAKMIDNANAMESIWWQFKTEPNAVYPDKTVYRDLSNVSLEHLIQKLAAMPHSTLTNAVVQIPDAWLGEDRRPLERCLKMLFQRQRNLRFIMHRWLHSDHINYFDAELLRDFKDPAAGERRAIN